jgi:alkylation response protein AidB-like acyl-CoA dehydrogenase
VGLAQACLDASLAYTSTRRQFGSYLKDHELIQRMITEMLVNVKAARMLCLHAGQLKDLGDPDTIMETWVAKYFAAKVATQAALDAVQIHGANGVSSEYPVQRYLRDSRVMEIIEGSTQIQQIQIARYGYERMKQNHDALN